jgi:hypothetical protein
MKKILPAVYIALSSVTALVMLVTSFEFFNEKYMPAFLMGQKFVLPVVLSILSVLYIFFFDPESLLNRRVRFSLLTGHILVLGIFAFYVITLDVSKVSGPTLALFIIQLGAICGVTILFSFSPRNNNSL